MRIDQTTADTLNKALDLAKQGVVAAFETVKQYAPYVWGIARRQVLLEGVELLVGWFILFITWATIVAWSYRRLKAEDGCWDDEDHGTCFWISTAVFVILTLIIMPNIIDFVGNPDYWTIRKILELTVHH